MPYTMEDLKREVAQDVLKELTPEERLEGMSAEQRLEGLSAEQLLSHLPLLEIEDYLRKQKAAENKASPDPQKPQSP